MPQDEPTSISLTVQQHRRLIELAYLGEWFINAHHDTEFQDDSASEALQKVLEAAQPMEGIERDIETGNYYLQTDWSDRLFDQYITDYDDHVFWDELTERLAQRDLARLRGVTPDEINREDDLRELKPLEEQYREELESNGVEQLEIKESF